MNMHQHKSKSKNCSAKTMKIRERWEIWPNAKTNWPNWKLLALYSHKCHQEISGGRRRYGATSADHAHDETIPLEAANCPPNPYLMDLSPFPPQTSMSLQKKIHLRVTVPGAARSLQLQPWQQTPAGYLRSEARIIQAFRNRGS